MIMAAIPGDILCRQDCSLINIYIKHGHYRLISKKHFFSYLSVYTRWAWNAAKWFGIQCWYVPSSSPHESEKESGSFLTTRSVRSHIHTHIHFHICTGTCSKLHFPGSITVPTFNVTKFLITHSCLISQLMYLRTMHTHYLWSNCSVTPSPKL